MIQAVIFDMDGTLVDTEPIYHKTNEVLYKSLGVKIDETLYETFVGIDSKKKWSLIKSEGNLSQSLEELIGLSKKIKLEALAKTNIPVFPGIPELIDELLSNDIKIGLASSSNWQIINQNLSRTGLDKYFEIKVSGEDIENGKPAPDIFLKAAQLIGCKPDNCLVIEDSKNGVLGTLAAGMVSVAHKDENSQQDLSMAHLVINSYSSINRSQILQLIDK